MRRRKASARPAAPMIGRLEELRVDSTHPPTYLRMEWVAALPYAEGRMPAEEVARGADGAELHAAAGRVARAIRKNAQSARYP